MTQTVPYGVRSEAGSATATGSAALAPYVPRVVVDWLRERPGARWLEIEGTLAFVDLSGFTAMSERLAALGKAGAEEVTAVMNATFARLLDVAYAEGGGLLKFGGDALLLFFSGEAHEARASRAAFGMRRALRAAGRPRTAAGTVRLQMHAGLHSDRFPFFLVGDSHRELLLAGPGVSTTVAMEDASEAGEILLSAATAAALPDGVLGAERSGGRLLEREPGAASSGVMPLPEVEGLELSSCVPAAIRQTLETGAVEAEHRQATVCFLRFNGTDALLAEGGIEAAAEALDELLAAVQAAANRHEVTFLETDIDRDGGRIVLVAGAPRTTGDDEERLLRTVLEVVGGRHRLTVRAGVNRGRVFAGEVGATYRRTYTILGDTAALAARLMARADEGQVLATTDVLSRPASTFEAAALEPFRVKGKTAPVVAHEVRGIAAAAERRPTQRQLPFVGRERELALIAASLAPVRMGFGSFVELTGDPGIGKSRLVTEIKAQGTDLAIASAACEQYEQSTAYFSFRGLLRGLLDLPREDDAVSVAAHVRNEVEAKAPGLLPWLPLLALALDIEVDPTPEVEDLQPAFRRARLHGAVEELLTALLPGPSLIVFEDVHWMDEASSELLRHLGSQVTRKPWLLCATRRPVGTGFQAAEGAPPLPAMTIVLEPLADAAAAALVEAAADMRLISQDVAAITARAGGNPLFLQELVAAPQREAEEALPETVESVVSARIDELAPADRTLLRYAAVIGASFSGQLVEDVLGAETDARADSEAWDRLAEIVERDPYTPGAFRFRHALFRDAAYEGLSYGRRRDLHARVGAAYERRHGEGAVEHAELLSFHFTQAQDWPRAYRYSLASGERAQAKHANVEAVSLYGRALDAARRLPEAEAAEVARIWESLGDVSEVAGRYEEAADAYRNARRLAAGVPGSQPRLLLKEGVIRERSARYPDALRWYTRGLRAAETIADERERRRMTLELSLAYAGVRLRQGNFADCVTWCKRVTAAADAGDDLAALAHAYYLQHLAYTSIGSREKEALRGLALPIFEELGDLLGQANVLNNLGIDAYYDGRWDEALDLYSRSRELRERIGDVVGAATITNNIGEIESDQGRLEAAEQSFRDSLGVFTRSGYRFVEHLATSNLGRAATRAGRPDEGRPLLESALAGFVEIGAASYVVETQARLAECDLLEGDAAAAADHAARTLAALGPAGGNPPLRALLHRLHGLALMGLSDMVGAAAALDASVVTARGGKVAFELAQSLDARAQLRDRTGGEAAADRAESDKLFNRLGVVSLPVVPVGPPEAGPT